MLTIIGPLELHILLGEVVKRTCHSCKMWDESAIIRAEPEESPCLSNGLWDWELSHSNHDLGVCLESLRGDHMPKILYLSPNEMTFRWPHPLDSLDDQSEMLQVVTQVT